MSLSKCLPGKWLERRGLGGEGVMMSFPFPLSRNSGGQLYISLQLFYLRREKSTRYVDLEHNTRILLYKELAANWLWSLISFGFRWPGLFLEPKTTDIESYLLLVWDSTRSSFNWIKWATNIKLHIVSKRALRFVGLKFCLERTINNEPLKVGKRQ